MPKIKNRRLDYIEIDQIDMGDRDRIEYGDLGDFTKSIKKHGVIQPIALLDKRHVVLYKHEIEDVERDPLRPYLLIAGGRRIRASLQADLSIIPAYIWEVDLPPHEVKGMEYAENEHRKNVSWLEEANTITKAHAYYVSLKREPESPDDPWAHHIKDTALNLGLDPRYVASSLVLSKAAAKWPEVAETVQRFEALTLANVMLSKEADAKEILTHDETLERLRRRAVPRSKREAEDLIREVVETGTDVPGVTKGEAWQIQAVEQLKTENIIKRMIDTQPTFDSFPKDFFHLIVIMRGSVSKYQMSIAWTDRAGFILGRDSRSNPLDETDLIALFNALTPKGSRILIIDDPDGRGVFAGILSGRYAVSIAKDSTAYASFLKRVEEGYPYR